MAASTSHLLFLTFPDAVADTDDASADTTSGTIVLRHANGKLVRTDLRDTLVGPNGGNIKLQANGVVHSWSNVAVDDSYATGGQTVGGYATPALWANTGDSSAPADHLYANSLDGTYYEWEVTYTSSGGTVTYIEGRGQLDADTDYETAGSTHTVGADECVLSSVLSLSSLVGSTSAALSALIDARVAEVAEINVSTGDGAPTSTPGDEGDIYVDTTSDEVWIAAGTASSADWKQATGGGGGGLSNVVEDLTPQLGGDLDLNGNVITGLEIGTNVQAWSAVLDSTTASFTTADETKLDAIEAGATADQTGAEIKAAYEAELDTNAYDDAAVAKLAGIEASADVTDATNVAAAGAHMSGGTDVPVADGGTGASTAAGARTNLGVAIGSDVQAHSAVLDATTASFTTADESKLDAVEAGATADQTPAEILSGLLGVDGAGSGLDADTVDGSEAAALLARANHTGTQASSTISDLATVVKAYRLDEFAAPTATVDVGDQALDNLAAVEHTLNTVADAGATEAVSWATPTHKLTFTEACTLSFTNLPATGHLGVIEVWVIQDATGGWATTLPAAVQWDSDTAPTVATTASTATVFQFRTMDGGTLVVGSMLATGVPLS